MNEEISVNRNIVDQLFNACPYNARGVSITGCQRGDEGKAKVVDAVSEWVDIVVRFGGGANAGHTIILQDGTKIAFHQVPSGTRCGPNVVRVIGRGCYVEPAQLLREIQELGRTIKLGTIMVDRKAAFTTLDHILDDRYRNQTADLISRGEHRATGWGISGTARDRAGRCGMTIGDAARMSFSELRYEIIKIREQHLWINTLAAEDLERLLRGTAFTPQMTHNLEVLTAFYQRTFEEFRANGIEIADCADVLRTALSLGRRVLVEGAQSHGLGVNSGAIPETTSSNGGRAGIFAGTGVDTKHIPISICVASLPYCTSVGLCTAPGVIEPKTADLFRAVQNEVGATTGIPRTYRWPDTVQIRDAFAEDEPSIVVVNRLDIAPLAHVTDFRFITAYKCSPGASFASAPTARDLRESMYIFSDSPMPCWPDIRGCRRLSHLPEELFNYLRAFRRFVELRKDVPIWVGNGPKTDDLIVE